MTRSIDAEGHVLEPADLWVQRIDRRHREQAFRVQWNEQRQREEAAGEGRIVWASDYPHLDVTAPCIGQEVREHLAGLSEPVQRLVLEENAVRLYGLA